MNLWEICEGSKYIKTISLKPWRVIEAQHISSSRDLVDTREEHDLLEEILEESKPQIEKEKNYLIFTPFRYPPLKYGSRFGRIFEPSLWYGSLELETAFTEVAYYRLQFLNDSSSDLGYLEIVLTAFQAHLHTEKGIDLSQNPFKNYSNEISHKSQYEYSQLLGTAMRENNIEACVYLSARTQTTAKNAASFTPSIFQKKNNHYISNQQTWGCLANKQLIEFTRMGISGKKFFSFSEYVFK